MTFEDLQYFETYYFGLNRRMLKVIGLWPYQEPKRQFILICIVNFSFITVFLMQMCELYNDNFNLIINQLHYSITTFCCFVCYNTGVYNTKVVMKLYDHVRLDIMSMKDEWERAMLRKYSYKSKLCTSIVALMMYGYNFILVLSSIFYATLLFNGTLNDTRAVLPLPFDQFLDTKFRYYGMILYQFQVIFVISVVVTATYTSFMALIQHSCLLLGIVEMKISAPSMKNLDDNRFLYFDASNFGYNWIIDIVTSYISATEFVELLNILSERVYLLEMGSALFILVISFLYILDLYFSEYTSLNELIEIIFFTTFLLFIIYINFYVGQMLIDHSTAVSIQLRQLPFYNISVKAQKILPLVILRCTRPCTLMIGGMFVSSHEIFSRLVKTSLSYAAVCYTMR